MRKPLRIFVLLILNTLFVLSPIAPTTTHADSPTETPLHQLLAVVPDTDLVRNNELSYTDFYAMFAARPGAGQPRNYQDWNKLKEAEGNEGALTNAVLRGIATGNSDFIQQFLMPEKTIASVGIDPFTVERSVFYGAPPATAMLLMGTFDPPAIAKALTAKGYEEKDPGTFQLWCATEDCGGAEKINIKDRDPANPFGGQLGRKQPIVFSPNIILSSTSFEVIEQTFMIGDKKQPSLAENPDFKAAADAITQYGSLLQAYFVAPRYLAGVNLSNLEGQAAEAAKRFQESATPLPAYSVAVFAHVVHDDKQLALIGLVYDTEANADTALKAIESNLPNYVSHVTRFDYTKLIEDREGKLEQPAILTVDDKSVLVLTFSAPIEPQEPIQGDRLYMNSGLLFHLFIEGVMRRDLGWLTPAS